MSEDKAELAKWMDELIAAAREKENSGLEMAYRGVERHALCGRVLVYVGADHVVGPTTPVRDCHPCRFRSVS